MRAKYHKFLFHTGSIKRDAFAFAQSPLVKGFYSTLVRLKDKGFALTYQCPHMFLFHTGSIKSIVEIRTGGSWKKFLFHTGSIKSFPSTICHIRKCKFLFHTGSIKRGGHPPPWFVSIRVSIPHWFD